MKRLIVLSTVLLTATLTLTSCWDKESEKKVEPIEEQIDALPQTKSDSLTSGIQDTLIKQDTLIEKK